MVKFFVICWEDIFIIFLLVFKELPIAEVLVTWGAGTLGQQVLSRLLANKH